MAGLATWLSNQQLVTYGIDRELSHHRQRLLGQGQLRYHLQLLRQIYGRRVEAISLKTLAFRQQLRISSLHSETTRLLQLPFLIQHLPLQINKFRAIYDFQTSRLHLQKTLDQRDFIRLLIWILKQSGKLNSARFKKDCSKYIKRTVSNKSSQLIGKVTPLCQSCSLSTTFPLRLWI